MFFFSSKSVTSNFTKMLIFVCFLVSHSGWLLFNYVFLFFRLTSLIREFVLCKKSPLSVGQWRQSVSRKEGKEVLVSVAEDLGGNKIRECMQTIASEN